MDRKLEKILGACIREIESGSGDLERCVAKYPKQAHELRQHLELWLRFASAAPVDRDPRAILSGRQKVLAATTGNTGGNRRMLSGVLKPAFVKAAVVLVSAAIVFGGVSASGALGGPDPARNVLRSVGVFSDECVAPEASPEPSQATTPAASPEATPVASPDASPEASPDASPGATPEAMPDEDECADDDDNSGPGSGDDDADDNSGPGNDDDDASDDNSGPGNGDDDASGPGSGDDDADSNSGPGNDDTDATDDNSGPGSGDDDNSSAPGSGDDGGPGSGSGDSSGSGSDSSGRSDNTD